MQISKLKQHLKEILKFFTAAGAFGHYVIQKELLRKKSLRKKNFNFFEKFLFFSFFWDTLYVSNFFSSLPSQILHTFWVTSQFDPESGS